MQQTYRAGEQWLPAIGEGAGGWDNNAVTEQIYLSVTGSACYVIT